MRVSEIRVNRIRVNQGLGVCNAQKTELREPHEARLDEKGDYMGSPGNCIEAH